MIFGFAGLSFAAPWAFGALFVLPLIWWLLKIKPPSPRIIRFPAVRFMLELHSTEQTPAKTPIWLLILRVLIAVLVILSIAGPVINPLQRSSGDGSLLIIVDDGWAAAANWEKRIDTLTVLLEQADRDNQNVIVGLAAPRADSSAKTVMRISGLLTPSEAKSFVKNLEPQPWPADRHALLSNLNKKFTQEEIGNNASVVWLSDGLDVGSSDETLEFAKGLQRFGAVRIYRESLSENQMLLLAPDDSGLEFVIRVLRSRDNAPSSVWVRATGVEGQVIDRIPVHFRDGQTLAESRVNFPTGVRNEITQLNIEGISGAGSVILLDSRWHRRPVGLISGGGFESSQPLLSDLYYLERALAPYNEIQRGELGSLVDHELSVLMLADVGHLPEQEQKVLIKWIERGGVLVRFAGPRLATGIDALVPTPLRGTGARALGGALSWQEPMRLGPFLPGSPFAGLEVPEEVLITRQVLAEPSMHLASNTWARLTDGTPLVTGASKGDGWLVLFHTSANADWSNLALSGLFVDMLRRIVELSEGANSRSENTLLLPSRILDGFGRLGSPEVATLPIKASDVDKWVPSQLHPPGVYGTEMFSRTFNLGDQVEALNPITELPLGIETSVLGQIDEVHLRPWLVLVALFLFFLDAFIALSMRGLLPVEKWAKKTSAVGFLLFLPSLILTHNGPIQAQTNDRESSGYEVPVSSRDSMVIEATRKIHLAYVLTGTEAVDVISRAGLLGLSWVLRQRTAVEPGLPVGVDPEGDDLVLYPLLYWPITEQQPLLSDTALANIDHYLKVGGMILLDTRDQAISNQADEARIGSTTLLQQMLSGLNLPALSVVSRGHALTQSFYLIDQFPGRWDTGEVWVEQYDSEVNDGVSSLVVGGNDWAGAWALSPSGKPLFPAVPGGERQREFAFRFGVNLTMYALTGNYKADQVHISTILGRLKRSSTELVE